MAKQTTYGVGWSPDDRALRTYYITENGRELATRYPTLDEAFAAIDRAKLEDARPLTDISVENHGTIALLRPQTPRAAVWLSDHTDGEAQWFGDALAVEPRYVRDIVEGAVEFGLEVR